ncbi:hypothetical protein GCM10027047_17730 [Rhodococcus aerolatus]
MSTTEQRHAGPDAPRTAAADGGSARTPSRRVAVAAAQVIVATDRKLGRETPEEVRRLARGSLRRSA